MNWLALRNQIYRSFSIEELRTLCFDLNIEYEDFPNLGKEALCRDLLEYTRRYNNLTNLIEALVALRPQIEWVSIVEFPKELKEENQNIVGEELILTFNEIGGLDSEILQLKERIESTYLNIDKLKQYGIPISRSILLYGPPGCGKTMLAKASANYLDQIVKAKFGIEESQCLFLKLDVPRIPKTYVGETENSIRSFFTQAKSLASVRTPVFILLDDMHVLFPRRGGDASWKGSGAIISQLLSELDALNEKESIYVVGATYKPELLDPAVLRVGRLDFKIHVHRPNNEASAAIFAKFLNPDFPIHLDMIKIAKSNLGKKFEEKYLIQYAYNMMIETIVRSIFNPKNLILISPKLDSSDFKAYKLRLSEIVSGELISNISSRAKFNCFRRQYPNKSFEGEGIHLSDLLNALQDELNEHKAALVAQIFESQGNPVSWNAFNVTLELEFTEFS